LIALADTLAVPQRYAVSLGPNDTLTSDAIDAPDAWRAVLLGTNRALAIHDPTPPRVLFPGAFNPLHDGHRALAAHAQRITGQPVAFEICANNVDKPRLNYLALKQRLDQFDATTPLWLTDTATFVEKARVFAAVTFAVGTDTLLRIAHPKYYGGDSTRLLAAVDEIGALGCSFLVFGRLLDGQFVTLNDIALPAQLRSLCRAVPEAEFRRDESSTQLRRDDAAPR
jgi:Cytidylyltransferase-like